MDPKIPNGVVGFMAGMVGGFVGMGSSSFCLAMAASVFTFMVGILLKEIANK